MSEIGTGLQNATGIRDGIARAGYAFVEASDMRNALARFGTLADWPAFAESWDDLEVDTYMADGGRYRRRRFGVWAAGRQGPILRGPHQPHYQTLDYNHLNGGIERWFKPISRRDRRRRQHAHHPGILPRPVRPPRPRDARAGTSRPTSSASRRASGEHGKPTPEGMHRDGVDYVLVLLVNRRNIQSGTTTVHDLDKRTLGSFTLTDPLDSALVDDARCYHGVTPVEPENPAAARVPRRAGGDVPQDGLGSRSCIRAVVQLTAKIGIGSQKSIVPLAPLAAAAAAMKVRISKPPWPPFL